MTTTQAISVTDEVIEFLASAPSQEQILEFKASEEMQLRLRYLLDKNREERLTDAENAELDEMERMDDFMTMLKLRIRKKMKP